MFPSLSTVCVFHIVQLIWTYNHLSHYDCVAYNVHENVVVILSFLPVEHVCTFIIIKSCFKFRIFLTNIRGFPTYSIFQEMNDLPEVTVTYATLNFKCFTKGLGNKSVCIAYKVTNLTIPFLTWFRPSSYFNIS